METGEDGNQRREKGIREEGTALRLGLAAVAVAVAPCCAVTTVPWNRRRHRTPSHPAVSCSPSCHPPTPRRKRETEESGVAFAASSPPRKAAFVAVHPCCRRRRWSALEPSSSRTQGRGVLVTVVHPVITAALHPAVDAAATATTTLELLHCC
ncbi:uncharacterized protein LOC110268186 isoform X1 [Arachis ipaensis]|uniref:uncharacterized protein LOC110268186 isoform X1 n=1 Tax=Arachis ipaensis TaxID=130454 RepID=UPI000A2B05EE|nr:uncharacterized protein LOC110268186 isoform X1 [Arachis ipaensis]